MKSFFIIVLLVASALFSHAQFQSATLQASGLTCAMCSKAIYKSLEKLPFVQTVVSDIKNSAFSISFKPSSAVDIDRLQKAVEEAGFSVGKLTLNGNFAGIAIENDEHVVINGRTFHFLNIHDQQLSGKRQLTMVDKDFLSAREFKKFSAATEMSCIKTGKAAACCKKEGLAADSRVYHVTI